MRLGLVPALTWAVLTALPLVPALAQHDDGAAHLPRGRAFSPASGAGWTFGYPTLDLNAGLFDTGGSNGGAGVHKFFFRAHAGMNTGIPHVGLSLDADWLPSVGATPVLSAVGQIDPLDRESPFYFSVGAGVITGHVASADRFAGWVQALLAYRTPVHELAPFIQAGHALNAGQRFEFLFGIAHPLAPYRLHL